jgi:DNA-nicking Smr family endonuclease
VAGRPLDAEEQAIWNQVASTIKPIDGRKIITLPNAVRLPAKPVVRHPVLPASRAPLRSIAAPQSPSHTLDANWDRRLSRGLVAPDRVIDLHGETLATAHSRLDQGVRNALADGARIILLITGKAARDNPRLPPTSRGVIRASIHDWLNASPYASRIAAIRGAHPRHGGAGALYVVMRRTR